ncbi:MAG: twitching motility protein PilT [Bacteroidetes bacterium]|nr:twitching motility protein PilT [Bacteroidota bacterium]
MIQISVRWYSELNDNIPIEQQYAAFIHQIESGTIVSDFISGSGIPLKQIDLILANGKSVSLEYQINDGDRIAVFPVFESFDISSVTKVREIPLRRPKFILDVHLGKLANHLRMLGFDTLYKNDYTKEILRKISLDENRTLLSKDKSLIENGCLTHAYLIKNKDPRLQLIEVLDRFQLFALTAPFTRCIECNSILQRIEKEEIIARIPEKVKEWCTEYQVCRTCDRIYWKGSHYQKMREFISKLPEK